MQRLKYHFLPMFFILSLFGFTKKVEASRWLEVEIGIIGMASHDVLDSAIARVQKESFNGLLIKLDTPGGALDATRKMVKSMMEAPFPVIVWVGPNGSRAASAGAFITLAGHVAAMAPGTNIGAAHPIQASGKDIDNKEAARKVEQDTVAFIESIAKARNRNTEMAASFVLTSISITAEEALESKVVDFIATDTASLFEQIDGRQIELASGDKVIIDALKVETSIYERSVKQEFLEILSNPNLFYLLFMAGLIGIGFELTHPGSIFPGVAGSICMILALIATAVLPVSFAAMLLTLAGVALIIAEAFVPSFGVLGIGGFVAFCLGSFLLVDPGNEQGLRISMWMIAPTAAVVAVAALGIGYLIINAQQQKVLAGAETMKGSHGEVIADFVNGKGKVRVDGEIWSAVANEPLVRNQEIVVDKADGLLLTVKPLNT